MRHRVGRVDATRDEAEEWLVLRGVVVEDGVGDGIEPEEPIEATCGGEGAIDVGDDAILGVVCMLPRPSACGRARPGRRVPTLLPAPQNPTLICARALVQVTALSRGVASRRLSSASR